MHTVYIGVGSNLGNRLENCKLAAKKISRLPRTKIENISSWRENPALTEGENEIQPDYINGALKISTGLGASELLQSFQEIEAAMGRISSRQKWAPRPIDLDILLFDDCVIETRELRVPHAEMTKRRFVLEPLCDIEPDLKHPVLGKTVRQLFKELK